MISKGYVSEFSGPPDAYGYLTRVRVQPYDMQELVSHEITLPWFLRGPLGTLTPGTEVIYSLFSDGTGYCHGRADGEWDYTFSENIHIKGNLDITDGLIVHYDTVIDGQLSATEIQTPVVSSLNAHRHGGVQRGIDKTDIPEV